jgi:hypothetical protein
MDALGSRKIFSILEGESRFRAVTDHLVRSDKGVEVGSYPELVEKIAELSFYNPEHVLLFRGQSADWFNIRGNTSIKPTIFRPVRGSRSSPGLLELRERYLRLAEADRIMAQEFSFSGRRRVTRYRILRWAILQHYEVCATPLLDVTHSLRVAASFATDQPGESQPVLYVLGVPALSGSVTSSSEQGFQIIRLSSICPPEARRPYFQEGYLLGEYPDLVTMDEKQNYEAYEIDFGRRLLAKFRLAVPDFWSSDYPALPMTALYPDQRDPLVDFTDKLKARLAGGKT